MIGFPQIFLKYSSEGGVVTACGPHPIRRTRVNKLVRSEWDRCCVAACGGGARTPPNRWWAPRWLLPRPEELDSKYLRINSQKNFYSKFFGENKTSGRKGGPPPTELTVVAVCPPPAKIWIPEDASEFTCVRILRRRDPAGNRKVGGGQNVRG